MKARRKNFLFGENEPLGTRVTHRRGAGHPEEIRRRKQEARERKKFQAQLKREAAARKKESAAEYKRLFHESMERQWREKHPNPAESAAQYRLAQAVLSGTARATSMTKKVAREIVDRTPAKLRKLFSKRNPEEAAAELSEAWHGRPAKHATDHIDKVHYHGVLTDLGRLKEITVMVSDRKGQKIHFDSDTRLASSENGKQLYVVGGDQSLDLGCLGIDGEEAEKDLVEVGRVFSLVYVTAKQHLGKADREVGPYEHELGEDGGTMPILVYDTMNETVGFVGGSYFIDPTDYDGSHSAGIRD